MSAIRVLGPSVLFLAAVGCHPPLKTGWKFYIGADKYRCAPTDAVKLRTFVE